MENWYIFAILALLLLGTQRFLYKVSAEKGFNTAVTTTSFMATVAVLSTILFFVQGRSLSGLGPLILISAINSGTFLIATISHIEALKRVPSSVAYPIIRLNVAVVVLFSIVFFKDRLTSYQIAGIVTAIIVILLLARDAQKGDAQFKGAKEGIAYVLVSLFSGAGATISSKFAALHTDKLAFMALSYTISMICSFGLRKRMVVESVPGDTRKAVFLGLFMGLINLGGFYAFLEALSNGPLSIIASIMGMHFVISILLSSLIYKEALTPTRLVGMVLTVLSVILLRL
ncbi:MAG: EamA family transporter [Deltaproteobacteria bacterium]|nr:EamA family transporter [Deltaproteobacteria bacterium]